MPLFGAEVRFEVIVEVSTLGIIRLCIIDEFGGRTLRRGGCGQCFDWRGCRPGAGFGSDRSSCGGSDTGEALGSGVTGAAVGGSDTGDPVGLSVGSSVVLVVGEGDEIVVVVESSVMAGERVGSPDGSAVVGSSVTGEGVGSVVVELTLGAGDALDDSSAASATSFPLSITGTASVSGSPLPISVAVKANGS